MTQGRAQDRLLMRTRAADTPRHRVPRWVVALLALALAALACIDVLNMTESYVWLDLTQAPHIGAIQHAKTKPAEISIQRAMQPAHATLPPLPFVEVLLVLLWFVVLPRAPAPAISLPWRPRLRGPPPVRLDPARP